MVTLKGGYTGKILRVNLTRKETRVEELDPNLAAAFIGGAGLGIKLLYDALPAGVDPLSPENVLIFAPGLMTRTDAPCASRMAVVARSPLTGGLAVALSAGHFPAELKFAGFDAVIIEGKAEKPVYLYIKDGEVQFRSAERLWGHDDHRHAAVYQRGSRGSQYSGSLHRACRRKALPYYMYYQRAAGCRQEGCRSRDG